MALPDSDNAAAPPRPRLFHWNPDAAIREANLRAKAADVFKPAFLEEWLQAPVPIYGGRTPLEITHSGNPQDFENVVDDLIRLDEGVYL